MEINSKNFILKNSQKILWLGILVYCIIISGLLIFKYNSFGYNAIDLGIYNQVFFNSAQGNLWQFSIHPHLYLGDHFELFIILLLPFYFFAQSPITLLILQTAFVALSAWPLYLIARQKLKPSWSLLIALSFLLNPFILNLNFFEFHILPFAIFILLFAFYFYLKNNFNAFILFIILSLLIREDIALVVFMFGILALLDRKKIKWVILPIILSIVWSLIAFNLIGFFNQSGNYKFLSLYGWLGETPREMFINFFSQPWLVIKQVFSLNNLFLLIGLLIPLAGLPLLRLKYLLPSLLIVIQLILTGVSSTVTLQTHYPALILPFLFIAAVFALTDFNQNNQPKSLLKTFILRQKTGFLIVLLAAIIYSLLTFSPLLPSLKNIIDYNKKDLVNAKNEAMGLIKNSDAIAASFDFLPQLSNRKNLYSLHYAFLGKKQFSDEAYQLPPATNKFIINFNDFLIYYLQSQNIGIYKEQYKTGADRINKFMNENDFGLKKIIDDIAVYEKNYNSDIKLIEKIDQSESEFQQANINLDAYLTFVTWEKLAEQKNNSYQIIPLSLYWRAQQQLTDDYHLELNLKNQQGKVVYRKLYPLGYGLYPTSAWTTNEVVKTNHWFLVPKKYNLKNHYLSFQVVALKGYMGLDGLRSAEMKITKKENIGPAIRINYNTL